MDSTPAKVRKDRAGRQGRRVAQTQVLEGSGASSIDDGSNGWLTRMVGNLYWTRKTDLRLHSRARLFPQDVRGFVFNGQDFAGNILQVIKVFTRKSLFPRN